MKVCLAPTHLVWNEDLGGHAWVFLNWALGLQANGCELVLLEKARWEDEPERLRNHLRAVAARLHDLGLRAGVSFVGTSRQRDVLQGLQGELGEFIQPLDATVETSDLLLNFRYSLPESVVQRFGRSVLMDIDPGLLQHWIQSRHVRPAPHGAYFSIGETVGRPGARFSDCGLEWHYTPPPVYLDAWPFCPASESGPFTTVTNWWGEYELIGGEMVNNEKRTEFLEYLGLPRRTRSPLELAIYQESDTGSDMPLLREHGWRTRPAQDVSATPQDYRAYIQQSRGEFSCAKRSCMALANAWISDRTLCYLASGRPAIVQHTGPSRFLPDSEGLLRFRSPDEAVRHLDAVEADYPRHAARARALAEEHFDAVAVTAGVLARAAELPVKRAASDACPQ